MGYDERRYLHENFNRNSQVVKKMTWENWRQVVFRDVIVKLPQGRIC